MRKTKLVQITDEGRDKGKAYLLTEMSAAQAEKWAFRALLLAAQSGADIPDAIRSAGFAGVAIMGIQTILGGVKFDQVEPLLDEMMKCIQFIPDIKNQIMTRPLIEDDIEEVATRVRLRMEVFNLHINFSIGDALSSWSGMRTNQDLPSTETFPAPSPP